MFIAIAVAIVAIAAVAGAYVLLDNSPEERDDNGTDGIDNTGDSDIEVPGSNDTDPIDQLDLKVGDLVEFTATSSVIGLTKTTMVTLTVTGVTPSGYDILVSIRSGSDDQRSTFRANSTEELMEGVAGDAFSRGTLIGDEVVATIYGDKTVEHWRSTTVSGSTTNVTDYYVGKSTGMVYEATIASTNDDILSITTTTDLVLSSTNIDKIKSGDAA
jgi:hypothetical protein